MPWICAVPHSIGKAGLFIHQQHCNKILNSTIPGRTWKYPLWCPSVAEIQFRTLVWTLNIRTECEVQFRFSFGSAKYTPFSSMFNSSQKNPNALWTCLNTEHWGYFYWQNQGKILHCCYCCDGCLHLAVLWLPCGYLTPPQYYTTKPVWGQINAV